MKRINFRAILVFIGLATIIIPESFNKLVDNNCNKNKYDSTAEPEVPSKLVVDAINALTYTQEVALNSKVYSLKKTIISKLFDGFFIKCHLPFELNKEYKCGLFKLNKITNMYGRDLQDSDLQKLGVIQAKINYNYNLITNQTTNLKINVVKSDDKDKKIVDWISFKLASWQPIWTINIWTINDFVNEVKKIIKHDLPEDLEDILDLNKFRINESYIYFSPVWNKLKNDDFELDSPPRCLLIFFSYGSIHGTPVATKIMFRNYKTVT